MLQYISSKYVKRKFVKMGTSLQSGKNGRAEEINSNAKGLSALNGIFKSGQLIQSLACSLFWAFGPAFSKILQFVSKI